jgi:predicted RNase H-like HicB family nuclease
MQLRAVIEFDSEVQAFSATCPELNFVSSCGTTKQEALTNLQEAILLMLEPLPEKFLVKTEQLRNYEFMEFVI